MVPVRNAGWRHLQQKYEKRFLLRWGKVGSFMRISEKLGSEVDMRNVGSMERRGFLKQSLSAVALGVAGRSTRGERSSGSAGVVDPAQLHRDAIVIDTYGKLYLEDFQKGHVDAIVHGIGVEEIFRSDARKESSILPRWARTFATICLTARTWSSGSAARRRDTAAERAAAPGFCGAGPAVL